MTREAAIRIIWNMDMATEQYLQRFHHTVSAQESEYDLVLNMSGFSISATTELIAEYAMWEENAIDYEHDLS